MDRQNIKIIIIPGNGGVTMKDHWFPYVIKALGDEGFNVIAQDFPDPILAREEYWLPFLKDSLNANENSILIGHSSGAIAAMRFAEKHKIYGPILIGAYYTDLGYEDEKKAGYFNKPWGWETIKSKQNWIIQFASVNDPVVPIEEQRYVSKVLDTEYHEFTNRGHFTSESSQFIFPEIIQLVKSKFNLD